MTMEKVQLPREVAEAIEHARVKLDLTDGNILTKCVRGEWESKQMQVLNDFVKTDNDGFTIAKALVNGYEVEQTPEDKVRKIYRVAGAGAQVVVEDVLNALSIKIDEVNA